MSTPEIAELIANSGKGRLEPLVIPDGFSFPLEHFHIPAHYAPYLSSVLLTHGMIIDRIQKLACDIAAAYADSIPHLLVVLKGGNEFASDLVKALRAIHAFSGSTRLPFTVDYVKVKSYEGTESTGKVTIQGVKLETLAGRDVVLVEDIIDTGITMANLIPHLKSLASSGLAPKSIKIASLLEKRTPKSCGLKADFVGFSIPNAFVVGYNMDYDEAFRDLQPLCVINKAGIEHFNHHPDLASLC